MTLRRHPHITDAHGQTMAEYSIVLAVVSIVVAVTFPQISAVISGFFAAAAALVGG